MIAGVQAGFNASSRLLYSVGRSGVARTTLGHVGRRRRTPTVAISIACVFAIGAALIAAAVFHGAYPAFVFFLTIVTLVWIALYGVICVSCFVFYWTHMRPAFNVVRHALVPAIGLLVLCPTMYYSVDGLEYPSNHAPLIIGIWMALGLVTLGILRARGVELGGERQQWLDAESVDVDVELPSVPRTRPEPA